MATTKRQFYRKGIYAGFVTRAVAFVIDLVLTAAILAVTYFVSNLLVDMFEFNRTSRNLLQIAATAAQVILPLLYYVIFWAVVGQTLGKALMGVRIVQTNELGTEPAIARSRPGRAAGWQGISVTRALLRLLVGYPLSAILFLGFLWVLVDRRRMGFHDKLAGTTVIFTLPEEITRLPAQPYSIARHIPR